MFLSFGHKSLSEFKTPDRWKESDKSVGDGDQVANKDCSQ